MYSLYSIVSICHNAETSHTTWLATNGASITPFHAVGTVKDCSADRAVLHAVCGALDSIGKKFGPHIVRGGTTPVQVLVTDNELAERLNAIEGKPLIGADRDLLGVIAEYKRKATITFFASIEDVPSDTVLAKVFKGWSHGWN